MFTKLLRVSEHRLRNPTKSWILFNLLIFYCTVGFISANEVQEQTTISCPTGRGTLPNCHDAYEINECESNPCMNGGTCEDLVNEYQCICPSHFIGVNCEIESLEIQDDPCNLNKCENGAECRPEDGNYTCICTEGYSGHYCQNTIDHCEQNDCENGATCVSKDNVYDCICALGWKGQYCSEEKDVCSPNPCQNSATCVDTHNNNFTCSCTIGFTGHLCDENIDDCASNPCNNNGSCEDGINSFTCRCPSNFMGRTCSEMYDACISMPCQNEGSCTTNRPSIYYKCECETGFKGKDCETNIDDCESVTCESGQHCIDKVNAYECRCPIGYTGPGCATDINDCDPNPCHNGATCIDGIGNYTCICESGFNGTNCDADIDECASPSHPCVNGVCVNSIGSYRCYCTPGYSGDFCDLDFNECLSHPCQNNATCKNLVNKYKCECQPGFRGYDCETNIDECEPRPCENNATCVDGINAFTCNCLEGFEGQRCEIDIDECLPKPCLNDGQCIDLINGYTCNCSDTGFFGETCEINIDECDPNPCQSDSNCTDLVKDYRCNCHPGFTGKNCEVDIDECGAIPCQNGGTCLEKSNRTLYDLNHFPRDEFSYSTAGGYACTCPSGFTGSDCEINIDDCDGHLCMNGSCVDEINNYSCRCETGFEGRLCETEINECIRYNPCEKGSTCVDRVGDYQCICQPGFGGRNCTVELTGCREHECRNNATCVPYLEDETIQTYKCSCLHGYHGNRCHMISTVSFVGTSNMHLATPDALDYSLRVRFRTTLSDGLLAFGIVSDGFYVLRLLEGQMALRVSLPDAESFYYKIGQNLNDATWHAVDVTIKKMDNSSTILMRVYDDHLNEVKNFNIPREFDVTTSYFGGIAGVVKSLMQDKGLREILPGYIGCMENVSVNGITVTPEVPAVVSTNVSVGCVRVPQCALDSCSGKGDCSDRWISFKCHCHRPNYGDFCNISMIPATFGYENWTSLSEVLIPRETRKELNQDLDISLFIRTREQNGMVFYLGSDRSEINPQESYVALELYQAKCRLVVRSGGETREFYSKQGKRLNDGYHHLIQVRTKDSFVSVSVNDSLAFRGDFESPISVDPVFMYLGSLPSRRVRRDLVDSTTEPISSTQDMDNVVVTTSDISDSERNSRVLANSRNRFVSNNNVFAVNSAISPFFDNVVTSSTPLSDIDLAAKRFKGILQDVRINNFIVEFYTPNVTESHSLRTLKPSQNTSTNVVEGVISDKTCSSNPCQNGGTCDVTWNDYKCVCPIRFRGKDCSKQDYCVNKPCPGEAECVSLEDSYECVSSRTFNGNNSSISFSNTTLTNVTLANIYFSYRSRFSGDLLILVSEANRINVRLLEQGQLVVSWQWNESSGIFHFGHNSSDGNWHSVNITFVQGDATALVDGRDEYSNNSTASFFPEVTIESLNAVFVGGISGVDNTMNLFYKGCLKEVRLNNYLLPFYDEYNMSSLPSIAPSIFRNAVYKNLITECVLCFEDECGMNSDGCTDPINKYECQCKNGFDGMYCRNNIDECIESRCTNGATCLDGIANYTCACASGFTGWLCETDIDECESNPCQNDGNCINLLAGYNCNCSEEYTGHNCERKVFVSCEIGPNPCYNDGSCHNQYEGGEVVGYSCSCSARYNGTRCGNELRYCDSSPCYNDGVCREILTPPYYECDCRPPYQGTLHCDLDECEDQQCRNGGTCVDQLNSFICNCKSGWSGTHCEVDIDECDLNTMICENGGTCINRPGSSHCQCLKEWVGERCNLQNPCVGKECFIQGFCYGSGDEQNGKTDCSCAEGHTGKDCMQKIVSDDTSLQLVIIIVPIIAVILIIFIITLIVFARMARKKRATRGTYSPSRQEMYGSRVEMGHVLKSPPEERLI